MPTVTMQTVPAISEGTWLLIPFTVHACGFPSSVQYLTYILDGAPEQAPAPDAAPGTDSLESGVTSFQWDPARTLRMAAAGLILSGPSLHVWYGLMARWRPGRDASSIAQKMLAGTFLYGPAFNAAFFSSNAALQGAAFRLQHTVLC